MQCAKKGLITLLIGIFTFITTACGNNDKTWALKHDNNIVSNGIYVYFLWAAYNNATLELAEEISPETPLDKFEIEGKNAAVWVQDCAINDAKKMLAIEKLFDEKGLTLSEEETKEVEEMCQTSFENSKETFDKYGISLEDFKRANPVQNIKFKKLFESVYGPNGSEAVPNEQILDYYKTNYVNVSIIVKSSDSNLESEDGEQTTNNSEDEAKVEQQFKNYVDMINSGKKTLSEVGEMFKAAEKLEEDPISQECLNLKDSGISEEIVDKVAKLELNKATYFKMEDAFLLLVKNDISTALPNLEDQDEKNKLLLEMKSSDFNNLVEAKVKDMNISVNQNSIKDYPPATFFKEE